MAFDTTIVSGGAHRITAELDSPIGAAATGLVVVVYGADGFEDNDRGPWARTTQEVDRSGDRRMMRLTNNGRVGNAGLMRRLLPMATI